MQNTVRAIGLAVWAVCLVVEPVWASTAPNESLVSRSGVDRSIQFPVKGTAYVRTIMGIQLETPLIIMPGLTIRGVTTFVVAGDRYIQYTGTTTASAPATYEWYKSVYRGPVKWHGLERAQDGRQSYWFVFHNSHDNKLINSSFFVFDRPSQEDFELGLDKQKRQYSCSHRDFNPGFNVAGVR